MAMQSKLLGIEEEWKLQVIVLKSLFLWLKKRKPPYACKVFIITDKQMDVAWETMNTHLENIKRCMKGNKPTIYNSPNIVTLDLENEIT